MARLAGIERITVSESIAVRVLILKREQDEGEQLLVHKLDESSGVAAIPTEANTST